MDLKQQGDYLDCYWLGSGFKTVPEIDPGA